MSKQNTTVKPAEMVAWLENRISRMQNHLLGNANAARMERAIRDYILSRSEADNV